MTARRFLLGTLRAAALLAAPSLGLGSTYTIDSFYDGGLVNVAEGDTLAVRLPSRAGCSWAIAMNDPVVLKSEGKPAAEAGAEVFRFQAVRGSTGLGFACQASPSPEAQPSGLYRVFVVVGKKVNARNPRLRESDSGGRLYLTQGDSLFVWLPATPSTGIAWTVARNATSVLKPVGDPKWEGPLQATPGTPNTQILEFRVVGRGGSFLELVYGRPEDPPSKAQKTWTLFVAAAGVTP